MGPKLQIRNIPLNPNLNPNPKPPKANKKPTKTYHKLTTICGVSITGSGGARWNVYWHRDLRGTYCNTPLKASPNLNLSLNPNLNLTLTFDDNIGRQVTLQSKNWPFGNFAVGNFAVGNFAVGNFAVGNFTVGNFGRYGDTVWSRLHPYIT